MRPGNYSIPKPYFITDAGGNTGTGYVTESHIIGCVSHHGNFVSPTPYSFSIRDEQAGDCYYARKNADFLKDKSSRSGAYVMGSIPAVDAATTRCTTKAETQAIDKFFSQLGGETNAAASMAEAVSAKVSANSNVIVSAINDRRRFESFSRRLVRTSSAAYLLNAFGIQPALGEIFGAIDNARSTLETKFRVTATSSVSERTNGNYPFTTLGNTGNGRFNASSSGRCKVSMWFKVNPLAWMARATSLDPAVIAWELLPYSFVVDYVYNVGGYLRNLEIAAQYGSSFMSGYKTVTSLSHQSFQPPRQVGASFSQAVVGYGTACTEVKKTLIRVGFGSLPRPQAPQFDCDLGSGQLLNCAALLGARIR
jgi:hypothetical protein